MLLISLISVTLLLILAAIATYLSVKNLLRWKEIGMDTTRARVFLDRSFLSANFKLTLVAVGLVFLHFILMEYIELTGFSMGGVFHVVYFGLFLGSMAALVMLVYIWYKLLHKK